MIVNSMIKRVDVYRNYDLNIELNMNIRRFFLGMEKQAVIFLVEISYVISVGFRLPRLGSDTSCQKSRLRSP